MTVLYEDSDVIAVAKPSGVAVIPGRDEKPGDALRGQLEAARHEKLWVVHRLDRNTSGVLLFARNAEAHRRLSMAFEAHEVSKVYWAWTKGVPAEERITIPLKPARKGKMQPARENEPGALPSETRCLVIATANTDLGLIAQVEAMPRTGRQHQIRVHLRAVGSPLLVDPLYARTDQLASGALGHGSPNVARLTLHARALTFPMADGKSRTVEAPLPPDLAALAEWISTQSA